MSKEYFYAGRWDDHVPGTEGAAGVVVMPAGLPREALARRKFGNPKLEEQQPLFPLDEPRRLLDPQVYLATLDPEKCKKTCTRLVSYRWFAKSDKEQYDSSQLSQAKWQQKMREQVTELWNPPQNDTLSIQRVVRDVLADQTQFQCEALILPSPLTINPSSTYSVELEWMDQGLAHAAAAAPATPALVTVAISDRCLVGLPPDENALLDTIADQVTARAPAGVYLVLEQAYEQGYYSSEDDTIASIFRLISLFRAGGVRRVMLSYCGVLGFAGLCLGADAWVSGWYKGERRLQLRDLEDDDNRRAHSAYYSHPFASEINVAKDLPYLAQEGLIEPFLDETAASRDLVRALRTKGAAIPADWRATSVKSARAHFNQVAIRETARISDLPDDESRVKYAKAWLANATKLALSLRDYKDRNDRTEIAHQRRWREAFTESAG